MIIHIYNIEHDLALAADMPTFTPPHAARQLRYDMGFLPALWAEPGEAVLVDNKERAEKEFAKALYAIKKLGAINIPKDVIFVEPQDLANLVISEIQPWGWNSSLLYNLRKWGVNQDALPTEQQLCDIRRLSSRTTAISLLQSLRSIDSTKGESFICHSLDEVENLLEKYDNIVIKAPWSSSGRGLRFGMSTLTDHQKGWTRNIIQKQGLLTVEPYYKKVKDFGMEFLADGKGNLNYCGLSLFSTHNGAYTGNIIATEEAKEQILAKITSSELLANIKEAICDELPKLLGQYYGPVGIDMMVLQDGEIHPCVEINLRRTMGHAALAIIPPVNDIVKAMRIELINSNYKLKIRQI